MFWILDVLVVAVIAVFAVLAARRGFVRTLIELLGFVALFVLIYTAGRPISGKLFDAALRKPVLRQVEQAVAGSIPEEAEQIGDLLPEELERAAELFGLDLDELLSEDGQAVQTDRIAEAVTDNVVRPIAVNLIFAVLSVVVFGIGMFLVRFLARMLSKLVNVPILGTANRVLGAVLGIGKGVIVAFVLCAAITAALSLTEDGFWIFTRENIERSFLFGRMAKLLSA